MHILIGCIVSLLFASQETLAVQGALQENNAEHRKSRSLLEATEEETHNKTFVKNVVPGIPNMSQESVSELAQKFENGIGKQFGSHQGISKARTTFETGRQPTAPDDSFSKTNDGFQTVTAKIEPMFSPRSSAAGGSGDIHAQTSLQPDSFSFNRAVEDSQNVPQYLIFPVSCLTGLITGSNQSPNVLLKNPSECIRWAARLITSGDVDSVSSSSQANDALLGLLNRQAYFPSRSQAISQTSSDSLEGTFNSRVSTTSRPNANEAFASSQAAFLNRDVLHGGSASSLASSQASSQGAVGSGAQGASGGGVSGSQAFSQASSNGFSYSSATSSSQASAQSASTEHVMNHGTSSAATSSNTFSSSNAIDKIAAQLASPSFSLPPFSPLGTVSSAHASSHATASSNTATENVLPGATASSVPTSGLNALQNSGASGTSATSQTFSGTADFDVSTNSQASGVPLSRPTGWSLGASSNAGLNAFAGSQTVQRPSQGLSHTDQYFNGQFAANYLQSKPYFSRPDWLLNAAQTHWVQGGNTNIGSTQLDSSNAPTSAGLISVSGNNANDHTSLNSQTSPQSASNQQMFYHGGSSNGLGYSQILSIPAINNAFTHNQASADSALNGFAGSQSSAILNAGSQNSYISSASAQMSPQSANHINEQVASNSQASAQSFFGAPHLSGHPVGGLNFAGGNLSPTVISSAQSATNQEMHNAGGVSGLTSSQAFGSGVSGGFANAQSSADSNALLDLQSLALSNQQLVNAYHHHMGLQNTLSSLYPNLQLAPNLWTQYNYKPDWFLNGGISSG